jgi:hypothetical protein
MRRARTRSIAERLALLFLLALTLGAADKKPQAFAVIAGTVFREPGFPIPGVEVLLIQESKKGKQKFITNWQGEYAFRIPPQGGKYIVKVAPKGFKPEEKAAEAVAGVRTEVTFLLQPESK